MMVQAVSGVNLGTRFLVEIGNLDQLTKIGRDLEAVRVAWSRAGAVLTGDWRGAIQSFSTLKTRMHQSLANANEAVAVMYYHDLQGAWETQEFANTWEPLNPDYLAEKIALELDRRTLIRTGDALASLGVEVEGSLSLIVGVTAESDDGEPYMVVQEFGSSDGTIPARPLFLPVLEAQLNRYIRVYCEAIEAAMNGGVYRNLTTGVIG